LKSHNQFKKQKPAARFSANLPVLPYFKLGRIKKKVLKKEILSEVTSRSLFSRQNYSGGGSAGRDV